jgi:pimeloyl-ACP methyl ester carboxylesterase
MKHARLKHTLIVLFVAAVVLVLMPRLFPGAILKTAMYVEHKLARVEEREIAVGDHNIRYLAGGPADGPVLLLLHGFGGDKNNWMRMARPLTERYRVIVPDLPGFGESTRLPNATYDLVTQAERIDAFTRALSLPPHHVAGNSMGGNLAGAYAVRFPDRTASVAFIANAGIKSPKESELSARLTRQENPLLPATVEQFEAMLDLIFVKRPWAPAAVMRYFATQSLENRDFNEKIWRDIMIERPYSVQDELEKIDQPVLILWGDRDRLLDVSAIEVMKPALPQARVVVLKDCGHIPMLERPNETAENYLSFLAAIADKSLTGRSGSRAQNTTPR